MKVRTTATLVKRIEVTKRWRYQSVVEERVAKRSLVPVERIEGAILVLRGHKVILDKDLAALYGVTTGNLNKAVNRNLERFPDDFMLRLTEAEFNDLRFQFGRSRWGGTRTLPRAFNEQGVAMLSACSAVLAQRS